MTIARPVGVSDEAGKNASAKRNARPLTKRSTAAENYVTKDASCSGPYRTRSEKASADDRLAPDDRALRQQGVHACPAQTKKSRAPSSQLSGTFAPTAGWETGKYRLGDLRGAGAFEAEAFPFTVTSRDPGDDPNGVSGLRRRSVNGMFASVKNRRPVFWSRRDERDLMHLLELDPTVVAYRPKPEEIEYVLDGKTYRHVPSFRATTKRGDVILDVLSDENAKPDARKLRIDALTIAYRRRGERYRALPGRDVRLQPRFGNACDLLRERAYRPGPEEVMHLLALLTRKPFATVGEIRTALPWSLNPVGLVCSMAIAGTVQLDLSATCREQVHVSLRPGDAR
jgi:hypothetical protein